MKIALYTVNIGSYDERIVAPDIPGVDLYMITDDDEEDFNIKDEIKQYISNDILTLSMKKDFLSPIIEKLVSIIISVTEESVSDKLLDSQNNSVLEEPWYINKCLSLNKKKLCNNNLFCSWDNNKCKIQKVESDLSFDIKDKILKKAAYLVKTDKERKKSKKTKSAVMNERNQ